MKKFLPHRIVRFVDGVCIEPNVTHHIDPSVRERVRNEWFISLEQSEHREKLAKAKTLELAAKVIDEIYARHAPGTFGPVNIMTKELTELAQALRKECDE